MNVLLALSGGIASTTLLAHLLYLNFTVATIGFNSNATYNNLQNAAAMNIAAHYNVSFTLIDISSPMSMFQSEILPPNTKTKKSHITDMLFISLLAGIAESTNLDTVAIGSQHCSQAFMSAMHLSTLFSSSKKTGLYVPFAGKSKIEILQEGFVLDTPYELTRTCSTNRKFACGVCENCIERLGLFKNTIREDPLEYNSPV